MPRSTFDLFVRTSIVLAGLWAGRPLCADELPGPALYQRHCVSCHGVNGEGDGIVPELGTQLRDREALADYLRESMPPETPRLLTPDEARRLADYVLESFVTGGSGKTRPRLQLAHLTARQHVSVIADLMRSFFGPEVPPTEVGLKGSYAAILPNGDGKQIFQRVDPDLKFDFGTSSPKPDEIDPAEFAISWSGSIRVPVSGDYEFIVRSPNSVRLYINNRHQPLIDAWVVSGDQSEFRETIRLLAGRYYSLTLHFSKAGQGGQKTPELRSKIAPAAIELAWKPPGRSEEVISPKYLSPVERRDTLILRTAFPPDDRSTGAERGTAFTPDWDQATTDAALEVSAFVRSRLGDYTGFVQPDAEHRAQFEEFCARFAERAFRRPLTPDERALFVDRQFQRAPDCAAAIERSLVLTLKSPRFLYANVPGTKRDGFAAASQLALVLWDSLPDDALLAAASAGELSTEAQVFQQARRMTFDLRFENKLRDFFIQWLKLDAPRELQKDPVLFAEFSPAVATDLRTSLELFLENVLDDQQLDFRRLLTADFLYLNARLAPLYGVPAPTDPLFHKFKVDSSQRAGLLTHPYVMAAFAESKTTSPIRRGVFLARSVLGRTLRPPPDAVTPEPPELHPDLTTRERTLRQTADRACSSCHRLINPLGFALEEFDAIGRQRDTENGQPIDMSGSYETRAGETVKFVGARELANYLVESSEVRSALIEKLCYHATQQPIRAFGRERLTELSSDFVENRYNLRHLMARIATLAAFGHEEPDDSAQSTEQGK